MNSWNQFKIIAIWPCFQKRYILIRTDWSWGILFHRELLLQWDHRGHRTHRWFGVQPKGRGTGRTKQSREGQDRTHPVLYISPQNRCKSPKLSGYQKMRLHYFLGHQCFIDGKQLGVCLTIHFHSWAFADLTIFKIFWKVRSLSFFIK